MKFKLSWRLWLLIFILIGSALVLFPNFDKGVVIKSVDKNSTAYNSGLKAGMIIQSINGQTVNNLDDYNKIISSIFANITKSNDTNVPVINTSLNITTNKTLNKTLSINSTINDSKLNLTNKNNKTNITNITNRASDSTILSKTNRLKLTIVTKDASFIVFSDSAPSINVDNIKTTRIKTGLDLSGGARALVKAQNKSLTQSELNDLVAVTSNRLNQFGISDVSVKPVSDLSGNNYMLIEIAGATPSDLEQLVSQQGKFEAKIGNDTLFVGGKQDITYVARTGDQSGIYSCGAYNGGYVCNFRFAITLSDTAAKRHATITSKLGINATNPEYLEKQLDLYLDDKLVESLYIGKELKGSETTQIAISGSGVGRDQQEAYNEATANMKQLQTVLITGSLPFKLEIVKIDSISPVLGKEFTNNMLLLGLIVFIGVALTVFIRYRKIKITLGMILTMFSEAFITLAIAALISWNLDAPGIAGIIAGIGTGVDDQIVIIDEALTGKEDTRSLKEKIKSAFFIIFTAFFLTVAAMLPLFWAGAGMLKGFALTTIIGVSIGVFITRPAFSDLVSLIVKE